MGRESLSRRVFETVGRPVAVGVSAVRCNIVADIIAEESAKPTRTIEQLAVVIASIGLLAGLLGSIVGHDRVERTPTTSATSEEILRPGGGVATCDHRDDYRY